MKAVHKGSVIDVIRFDPFDCFWPKGVARVTRETPFASSVDYVLSQQHRKEQTLRSGDYVATVCGNYGPEKDSLLAYAPEPEPYYDVIPQDEFESQYVVLGEVDPQS